MRKWLRELKQLGKVEPVEKGRRASGIPKMRIWQRLVDEPAETKFGVWRLPGTETRKIWRVLKSLTPYAIGRSSDSESTSLADADPNDPVIFSNLPLTEIQEEVLRIWRTARSDRDFLCDLEELLERKGREPRVLMLILNRDVWASMQRRPFQEDLQNGERELRRILKFSDATDLLALRKHRSQLRRVIKRCESGKYDMPSPTLLSVSPEWTPRQLAEFYRMQLAVIEEFLAAQDKRKAAPRL
jgi:hypothetical protein